MYSNYRNISSKKSYCIWLFNDIMNQCNERDVIGKVECKMYSFNSRIRYSELNHQKGELDAYAIINYFQDCSTFQSEDLNRGLSYLQEHNRVWLLNSWQLEIRKPAHLGENITIGTWAYDFKGFYGYRNFIMKDSQDNPLAVANSIWVYLDTVTGKPVKVPYDTSYPIEPAYPMEYANRKISIPDALVKNPQITIVNSNIDSYNHVNNGQYIKMAQEFIPDSFSVRSMRAEYRRQAVMGDAILPMTFTSDNCITVVLADADEKPYAIVEFQGESI